MMSHVAAPAPKNSRAGRDLPAAITVGVLLGGLALAGLFLWTPAFLVFCTVAALIGVWEVCRSLRFARVRVPQAPLYAASLVMPAAAYYGGAQVLAFALLCAGLAVTYFRALQPGQDGLKAVLAGLFVLMWVPFFISFAMLLLQLPHGTIRMLVLLILVVSNDTFGYIFGVLFGRHPMAPTISPKKSWEGFAGSFLGSAAVGVLCALFLLEEPWWFGLLLAVSVVVAATSGDLAESMVKRELGIKDMSNILPGHGGVMDRLDSMLFGVVVAYSISLFFLPILG